MLTCIVCGMGVSRSGLEDHRDAAHPGVKKTIPIRDLYRDNEGDRSER